jgi:hypothetical protein
VIDGLTFDPEAHAYAYEGVRVPGVTSILEPLVDFSRVDPQVLAAKADLGRRVHEACHFWSEDDLDEESVQLDVDPYLQGWKRFVQETGARIVSCEQRVYEPLYRYAGTLDVILDIAGERHLVDIKTSIARPLAVGAQTAGYLRALRDPSVTRRSAVRLRPDGTYRLDSLTDPDDWSVFLASLTLYRYKERHASAQH